MRSLVVTVVLATLCACSASEEAPLQNADAPALPADEPSEPPPGDIPPPDAPPAMPEPPMVDASQTQCVPGENYLYSCPLGGRTVVSVCVGNRQVSYRFGPLGEPELDLTVRQGQPGVWQGGVVGQGGGQQTHMRFRAGGYDYIVHSGYTGSLADNPGHPWSGVVVMRGEREVRRLDCPVQSSQTEIPSSMIPDYIPAETDPAFDAWY